MTLLDTIRIIEKVAGDQPAINTIVPNDIFRLNALKDARYGVFSWSQGTHSASIDRDMLSFSFTLYYADRLMNGERNEVEIQSVGIEVLDNIIRRLADEGLEVTSWTYQRFNQRFADLCAGVYAPLTVRVPKDYICAYDYAGAETYHLLTSEGWKVVDIDGQYILVRA